MKKYNIRKHDLVQITDKELLEQGIVAVQLVTFYINFFGIEDTFTLDTRIYQDGKQEVIDGNGWIKHGTLIN